MAPVRRSGASLGRHGALVRRSGASLGRHGALVRRSGASLGRQEVPVRGRAPWWLSLSNRGFEDARLVRDAEQLVVCLAAPGLNVVRERSIVGQDDLLFASGQVSHCLGEQDNWKGAGLSFGVDRILHSGSLR